MLPIKHQPVAISLDLHDVSGIQLVGGNETGEGIDQISFHRSTKRPSSEVWIDRSIDDERPCFRTHLDQDRPPGMVNGARVDVGEELVEDLLQMLATESGVDQCLVKAVQEFEGKGFSGGSLWVSASTIPDDE